GAARAASLSCLRDACVHDAGLSRLPQRGVAHRRHLRHQQHPAPERARLADGCAARILLVLPRPSRAGLARRLVADPLAVGSRLRGAAREPGARALARRRYPPLYPDGLCARCRPRRHRGRALCAAGAVHRSLAVRARAFAQPAADGRGRRLRLLLRPLPRRHGGGAAARMAALHRGLLPDGLRGPGDRPDGVLPRRPARPCRAHLAAEAVARGPGERPAGGRVMTAVLEVRGLEKRFGGIVAVAGVSFELREGEILGIIGPNGSGKSTLFNCILGQLRPTAGDVRLDGRPVTGMRPCDLNRLGVSRTFQLLQIFPQLSVRENLILAGQEHKGTMLSRLFGPRDAGLSARADEVLGFFRLGPLADELAGGLSYGQQKLLDAAMAFMAGPRLALLDEPAGGVNLTMLASLRDRLKAINAEFGATFVVIEHNMEFVMAL